MHDCDVAVVGYGPTGMTLAALLGQLGHRVVVLERHAGLYNLPRAACFDDETMRLFQKLGLVEALAGCTVAQHDYEWVNAAGEVLVRLEYPDHAPGGWAALHMMYQPGLEDALDRHDKALPGVAVRQGATVSGLRQDADGVTVHATGPDGAATVRARFVVGADGGSGLVRGAIGTAADDYGFQENWLVCDFRMRRAVPGLPMFRQICDPAQPVSIVRIGPENHRFSFMLNPGETREEATRPDRVWARVRRFVGPDDAELIRVANYTFRSRIARRWRQGRALLAGDAAHEMPPFLGQGMCSGLRDAHNLAWKLDLVLRGLADDALLDTYQAEREPHVRFITEKGIELGRVQTIRDPAAARARDEQLLAKRRAREAPDKVRLPGLSAGLVADCGEFFPQGRVRSDGRTRLFDDAAPAAARGLGGHRRPGGARDAAAGRGARRAGGPGRNVCGLVRCPCLRRGRGAARLVCVRNSPGHGRAGDPSGPARAVAAPRGAGRRRVGACTNKHDGEDTMQGKVALEEHFAIPDTVQDSAGVLPDAIWTELEARLLDMQERRLREMDAHGVETMVLSLNSPAVQAIADRTRAREVARRANDFLAGEVRKRPDRFRGLAALPMQDPDVAARELRRCVEELGFCGALVNGFSQVDDPANATYYDLPQHWPFWAEVERLDVPFYLHPRNPLPQHAHIYDGHPWLLGPTWAFGQETAVHALRLMASGLFDKHPGLQVILGHLGENLPYSMWRVDNRNGWTGKGRGYPAKRMLGEYFRENFHVTTSGNFRTQTLIDAILEIGADRILFSADWPFEGIDGAAAWFDACCISEADRLKIGRTNARRLLKLDAAPAGDRAG